MIFLKNQLEKTLPAWYYIEMYCKFKLFKDFTFK